MPRALGFRVPTRKPAKRTKDGASDVDAGSCGVRAQTGVLSEEEVLSDVFALRPASIPEDVCDFALARDVLDFRRGTTSGLLDGEDAHPARESTPEPGSQERVERRSLERPDADELSGVATAIAELSSLREDLLRDAAIQLVELAGVISERVISRELRTDSGFVRALVKEGVEALAQQDRVTVRLGRAFADQSDALIEQLSRVATATTVIVDPELPASGCVVESTFGEVDESLDHRLDVVMDSMRIDTDDEW